MPDNQTAPRWSEFKRTYQACLPCRKRKVRCDLGDIDAPNPPCVRCRRERKDCVFSTKNAGADGNSVDSEPGGDAANKRRRIESGPGTAEPPPQTFRSPQNGLPIAALVNSDEFTHPATIHHASPSRPLSDSLVRTVVSNASDALHLFFEAAELDMQSDAGGFDLPAPQEPRRETLSGWSPYHSEVTSNMQRYAEIAENCPPLKKFPLVKQKWLKPRDVVAYVDLYKSPSFDAYRD
jgi:Fungal Zn(2)-Cys(6) binuclear cluster domain